MAVLVTAREGSDGEARQTRPSIIRMASRSRWMASVSLCGSFLSTPVRHCSSLPSLGLFDCLFVCLFVWVRCVSWHCDLGETRETLDTNRRATGQSEQRAEQRIHVQIGDKEPAVTDRQDRSEGNITRLAAERSSQSDRLHRSDLAATEPPSSQPPPRSPSQLHHVGPHHFSILATAISAAQPSEPRASQSPPRA